jgi:quinol monooxygenase YgiN
MQLYARPTGEAPAIGTWEAREHAEAFMRTGVFQRLLARLEGLTTEEPQPSRWELRSFAEAE